MVINTHCGLFRYTRLPFGISSAPGIFQRVIESLPQGIDGVVVSLDDILVTGSTEESHLRTLDEVLSRLDKAGLRVKQRKCAYLSLTLVIVSMLKDYTRYKIVFKLFRRHQRQRQLQL